MRWKAAFAAFLCGLSLSACAHNPESFYFGKYSEGETLFNQGKYEEAIVNYSQYLNENPQGNMAVISKYYIARSHVALGQAALAKPVFEGIIKDHSDSVWANFSKNQLSELAQTGEGMTGPEAGGIAPAAGKKRRHKWFYFF
ncbi:MAG: tetratricopeptide repeat protein [Candidatus Omnitrophota bacterium]|jgi:TolA-binding protein